MGMEWEFNENWMRIELERRLKRIRIRLDMYWNRIRTKIQDDMKWIRIELDFNQNRSRTENETN